MNTNKNRIVNALNQLPIDRPPIWLMRQAGRYLPEYRELRSQAGSFLDLCYSVDLAAEVTLQPIQRFQLDAAIMFSDILVIPDALWQPVAFKEGIGPVLEALTTDKDIAQLDLSRVSDHLVPVYDALSLVKSKLSEVILLFDSNLLYLLDKVSFEKSAIELICKYHNDLCHKLCLYHLDRDNYLNTFYILLD